MIPQIKKIRNLHNLSCKADRQVKRWSLKERNNTTDNITQMLFLFVSVIRKPAPLFCQYCPTLSPFLPCIYLCFHVPSFTCSISTCFSLFLFVCFCPPFVCRGLSSLLLCQGDGLSASQALRPNKSKYGLQTVFQLISYIWWNTLWVSHFPPIVKKSQSSLLSIHVQCVLLTDIKQQWFKFRI